MGSVTKHGSDTWRARWRTPEGLSRSKNFKRKLDAERWITETEHSKNTGSYIDPAGGRVTLAEYAEAWRVAQVHRPSTQVRVESALRVHVIPALGGRPMGSIRTTEVQGWVRALSEQQMASTVGVNFRLLATIFRAAVQDRLIAFSPCAGVKLPTVPKHQVVPLSLEEIVAITDAIGAQHRPLVLLAAGAGLRLGEALGLEARHIDFLRRQLVVEQQSSTVRNVTTLGPVKTGASKRNVPASDVVLNQLAAWLECHPRRPDQLLVTDAKGGGPLPHNRFGELWRVTLRAAGLPKGVRYHDLRHTYASALKVSDVAVGASFGMVGDRCAVRALGLSLFEAVG